MHLLEFYCDLSVDEPARQVVGYSPLTTADICYPIVAVHVGDAEQIKAVETEPDATDTLLILECSITHADIGPFVGWRPELLCLESTVRSTERQSVGIGQSEGHAPTVCTREIVGEMHIYRPSLVCGQGDARSVESLACVHQ